MTSKKTSGAAASRAKSAARPAVRTAKPAVKTVAKTVKPAAETAKPVETLKPAIKTVKPVPAPAARPVEKVAAAATAKLEKGREAAVAGYTDLVGLQQDNFDAVLQSGSIMAQGCEAIGKEVMSFTQGAMEANMAAAKAIFGAKSLQELLDRQAGFARESLDKAVAESAKLGEMTVKMTSEAAAPIQARMNAAVENVIKQTAA